MTPSQWDVIVVGLGGMGSAAAAHLARRGRRVLGLERFTPVHNRGSSHGETRLIRQAYFEDPAYVPLLLRAYELWEDLDRERPGIFTKTGGLTIGSQASRSILGCQTSALHWNLPHELLDADEIRRRFPVLTPSPTEVAFYERAAGYVWPEETVRAHLERAAVAGAEMRFEEPVISWRATADGGIEVASASGRYTAEALVLAPGAWASRLLVHLAPSLTVERQLLFWFMPEGGLDGFRSPQLPVYLWEDMSGMQMYGFPACGSAQEGAKVAFFRNGIPSDPDSLDREIRSDEIEQMRAFAASRIPRLPGRYQRGLACMYTTTPDEHFIIGRDQTYPQVTMAAGFSGHGFKFVPVVGEIVADLVIDGTTHRPIELFDPARLGP